MKKLIFSALFLSLVLIGQAQSNKAAQLQDLEKNQPANQNGSTTATLTSATRLFGEKGDLTTVIEIVPKGSSVTVLDSDSTYLHVALDETQGYIFKRDAAIDKIPSKLVQAAQPIEPKQETQPVQEQPQQEQQVSRFTYLENKYGSNMAARLISGKIWKGMNAEMVKDSWGSAEKINRVISGNVIKEEWIFRSTWLYFENNSLVEWGPRRN